MTTTDKRPLSPIRIIGSGALGSLFAAFLESHSETAMLSHWPEQIEALRSGGLTCVHLDGHSSVHNFFVTNNPRELEPVRIAFVLVKSYQTARAAFELAPILAPDGIAITLQNGLGNFETLEAALGHGRVAQGVTAQGATMMKPGKVRHAGSGPTHIAMISGKRGPLEDLVLLLNTAGLPASTSENVNSLQWGKLAINAGINPLTALLRVRNGFLVENEAAQRVMCAAAEETAAVALELGISLPYSDASARVTEVAAATAENYSSMLQDILRGAPTEIDAINGAVSNYGRQIGMPTPLNDELWRLVTSIQPSSDKGVVIDSENVLKTLLNKLK